MRSKNESKNINRDYSFINILAYLAQGWLNINAFAFLLALIALKELLNMNMIKFLSIPGLISALAPLLSCYLKMQVNGFKLSNLKV